MIGDPSCSLLPWFFLFHTIFCWWMGAKWLMNTRNWLANTNMFPAHCVLLEIQPGNLRNLNVCVWQVESYRRHAGHIPLGKLMGSMNINIIDSCLMQGKTRIEGKTWKNQSLNSRKNNLRYLLCCWRHSKTLVEDLSSSPLLATEWSCYHPLNQSSHHLAPLGFQVASLGAFLKKIQVPQEAMSWTPSP